MATMTACKAPDGVDPKLQCSGGSSSGVSCSGEVNVFWLFGENTPPATPADAAAVAFDLSGSNVSTLLADAQVSVTIVLGNDQSFSNQFPIYAQGTTVKLVDPAAAALWFNNATNGYCIKKIDTFLLNVKYQPIQGANVISLTARGTSNQPIANVTNTYYQNGPTPIDSTPNP